MGPILVNTKQKVAVLAAGLAIAATGFVAPTTSSASNGDDRPADSAVTQPSGPSQ